MITHRIFSYTAIAALLLLLVPVSQAQQSVVLQLRWLHQAQFIGYYVAKHKGFYQDAGFDVEILAGRADTIPWREVVEGRADFAVDNSNAFTAFSEQQPVQALAAVFQHSPSVLLVRQDSQISHAKDLKGKRIMLFPNDQDPELLALLHHQQLGKTDVQLLPTSTNIEDLITGKTDAFNAYITNEPYFLEQKGVGYQIINPRDYGIDFYSDLLISHNNTIAEQPEKVERFMQASLAGWRYALAHPEEALKILHTNYPVLKNPNHSRFELNQVREMILPDRVELGEMNITRWQRIEQDLRTLGIITQPVNVADFLYKQQQGFNFKNWLPWLISAATIIIVVLLCTTFMIHMNYRLHKESKQRRLMIEQMHRMAKHDPLTKLPNRNVLMETLETVTDKAQRQHMTPALFYIDLDGFKEVNDSLGHEYGDRILQLYAKRMKSTLHGSDVFGRLAGDEFLLISSDTTEESTSSQAMRMMELMEEPFMVDNHCVQLSASIGIARYTDYNESMDALLNRADRAMHQVKAQLKSGYTLAHPPVL